MKKSNKFLKITGILMIIGGSFAVVAGVIILIYGVLLVTGNIHDPGLITQDIGSFAQTGIAISVLGGIVQFITGIIGVKYAKRPEKANTCIVFGTITAFLFIASQVLQSTVPDANIHFSTWSLIFGLLVPAFYLIGAVQQKEKGH